MAKPFEQKDNLFMTCAIHLIPMPKWTMWRDPPCCHGLAEAVEKMDRFCHRIYKVPVTWMCSYAGLQQHAEQLKRFVHEYGDEVTIMEGGIASRAVLDNQPEVYQGWVEDCGLKRPGEDFQSKEAEAVGARAFHDMGYDEQKVCISYLKDYFDRTIGVPTRTLSTPCTNADTIRIMMELGMDVSWGYCWNYFCEGMNHKGSVPYPFYISPKNHSVPDPAPGQKRVLGLHWGMSSAAIYNRAEVHSKHGGPGFCSNPLELANRSEGLEKYDLHRKLIREAVSWAQWNPYGHLPLQLEAIWLSEDEISPELHDMYPTFNSANTEVLYTQIEECLRCGAKPVTFAGFADWHREHVGDTAEMVQHHEDPLPEVRNRGKDAHVPPLVLYGSSKRQFWFDRGRGFNYVRRYSYTPVVPEEQIVNEYPFDSEPRVYLRIKHSANVRTGLVIRPEGVHYELSQFDLTAYDGDPDYAAILWHANIPSYVKDEDITIGGALKGFKTIRPKNLAILFAELAKGENSIVFRSDLPGKHVRIVSAETVGKRFEVWIENDADEAYLNSIEFAMPTGLRIGGFWWDGHYSRTIFRYGWGHYSREDGKFWLASYYPVQLKINRGLTRMSVELL